MATLHLVCGLPGSGKSTFAAELVAEGDAVWLSPDEWMSRIVGDGYDEHRRTLVEQVQWELAQELLRRGVSVVLDNGFWTRAERDTIRRVALTLGANTKLHFLDVPLPELERRIHERNRALPPNAFAVELAALREWSILFEAPTPDELSDHATETE